MSGAFASITLERKLSEQLARAQREGANLSEPMDEISEKMLANTRARFLAERAPSGVPWKKSNRAISDGGKTLQLKKFLLRSLGRRFGANFAEAGVEAGAPQEAYAAAHQEGSNKQVTVKAHTRTIKEAFGVRLAKAVTVHVASYSRAMNLPARPYLGFGQEDRDDITDILTRFLRGIFGEGA